MATYEEIATLVKTQFEQFLQVERECITLMQHIFTRMQAVMQIPEGKLAWAPVGSVPGGHIPFSDAVPQSAIVLQNDGYYRAIWDLHLPHMIASFVVLVRAVEDRGYEVRLSDVPNTVVSRTYEGVDALLEQLSAELMEDAPGHFQDLHRKSEKRSLGFRLSDAP